MHDYIAFLRGINLGRRRLKMDALGALFEQLKFKRVATFIASGNVLFADASADEAALRARIEHHLRESLGYDVEAFLRRPAEVRAIAQLRPFAASGFEAAAHTVFAALLQQPLAPALRRRLVACGTPVDHLHVEGREIYWLCQIRSSDSTLWTSPAVKALHLPSMTMRNMNTLVRLQALCARRAG